MNLLKIARHALAGWVPGGRRVCCVCGKKVWRFMPYQYGWLSVSPLLRQLDIVGSDPEAFECPRCGSHDRERHLMLFFIAEGLGPRIEGRTVVHFAPEKHLPDWIRDQKPSSYIKCDLYPAAPDVQRVDMLSMPFADASVDVLVANHVLEHVDDDMKALSEICRVLKVGGVAVLQTPYSRALHRTWTDPGIVTKEARTQAFGQSDHVRLYGRDIFERFALAGLVPRIRRHQDALAGYDADRTGVNADEPFFLFERPG